jgi:protein-histidine N-methyltransferase
MSPLSTPFRSSVSSVSDSDTPLPPADPTSSGELPITAMLIEALLSSLTSLNISLRFFSGGWESFNVTATGGQYDLVLSSETIYQVDTLPALLNLLKSAVARPAAGNQRQALCLVAAKVLYFGVGGGIPDFMQAVSASGGTVNVVREHREGVGRQILEVHWPPVR